ncbi:hypothetical protein WV31_10720 [Magnetospirillum sp. ME-1]|uniref:hypothetical protein n=1 Tax=Magnetospirillum sp. ME-1 TaxID=1639348 RepID=UPI000A17D7AA|nr:hypothetical protein [Magnetospirillum sp. ME-1]ARJ66100.1 hypothetical protein WV31_10720 [Magnetospirillum sp. ME-1]
MPTNRERLIAIMERDGLSERDVAAMVQAPPATVHAWVRPESNAAHRKVSDRVLQLLDLALGARIEFDVAKAADALGTTISMVKRLAEQATIILDGALWADRAAGGELMRRIQAGEVVELRFGTARALASSDWAFIPVANGPKTILLAAPARILDGEAGPVLDARTGDWTDARARAKAASAATRLNGLNAEEARLEARIVGTSGREREGIEAALRANQAARSSLDLGGA